MNPPLVSVVIPNWNGKDLLEDTVPAMLTAMESAHVPYEVVVVDDASTDDSLEWLSRNFVQENFRIIARTENGGFSHAINDGIFEARGRFVLCLNSDMILADDSIPPLIRAFEDIENLFCATMCITFLPGARRQESGHTVIEKYAWQFSTRHLTDVQYPIAGYYPVAYGGGGSSLYDAKLLRKFGGFDTIYSPFYFEDSDLGCRAWQRGLASVIVTSSRAIHRHRGTIGRSFPTERIDAIIERNRILFHWNNLSGLDRWKYDFRLRLRVAKHLLKRDGNGLTQAYRSAKEMKSKLHPNPSRGADAFMTLPLLYKLWAGSRERYDILILCAYNPFPPKHGGAVRMYNSVRHLLMMGKRLSVMVFVEDDDDLTEMKEEALRLGLDPTELIPVLRRGEPPNGRESALKTDFSEESARYVVDNLMAMRDYQQVWAEYTQMGQYLSRIPKEVKRVLIAHDVASISAWRTIRVQNSKRQKLRQLVDAAKTFLYETDVARDATHVLTVSEREQNFIKRYTTAKVFTSPTGVDIRFTPSFEVPTTSEILFVGSLRHDPNREGILHFIEKIWPKVQEAFPSSSLRVVGAPIPSPVPQAKNCTWLGFVPNVTAVYTRARVVIAPIYRGAGIRIKILEALAYGKPVVTTAMGAEGLLINNHEHALVVQSDEDFAGSIVTLLQDSELCKRLGTRGFQLVEKQYNWRTILLDTLEFIG